MNSPSLPHPRLCLFVYGTLQRGQCRAAALAGQRFLGEACTEARYRLFDCGAYPGLVEAGEGGRQIQGEVWEVDRACLAELDRVEGVASGLYRRGPVRLDRPFDDQAVQTYFYNRSLAGLPDCGTRWLARDPR